MSEEIGIFLRKMIGEVWDVDLEIWKGDSEHFLHVWVVIAANEPLKRRYTGGCNGLWDDYHDASEIRKITLLLFQVWPIGT